MFIVYDDKIVYPSLIDVNTKKPVEITLEKPLTDDEIDAMLESSYAAAKAAERTSKLLLSALDRGEIPA